VSNIHATADVRDHQASAFLATAVEVAATLQVTIRAFVVRQVAALEQRFTQRQLARFSDHMLRDFGFERDWDGSIRSLRDVG
jgi:uncharacterized protein YjiS (DUF1127 family)